MTLSDGLLSSKSVLAAKRMASFTCCFFFGIFVHFAEAQDNVGDESTIRYPAEYFVDFNPMTAQDMVYRIPGVQTSSRGRSGGGSGGRGFGSGGSSEIIINGKRAAGKSNATGQQLQRITAQQVNYIEIIRGTSGELDVRGSGQIVNVVLFEELSSTAVNYEINMESYADQERKPGGSLALSGKAGQLGFVLSGEIDPRYENQVRKEHSVLADYSDNDYIREDRIRDQTNYNLSANLDYEINEFSSARLNALYREDDNPTEVFRKITDVRSNPNVVTAQREDQGGERNNWEVGGDYELNRTNGDRFKLLFIANQRNDDQIRARNNIADDGAETLNLFLDRTYITEERIVRGSYTTEMFFGQDIEFGIERAQTTLESGIALGLAGDGLSDPSLRGLVRQNIRNADSTVEEIRYEPFLIHNYIFSDKMSLETSLLYEASEISQWGQVNKSRDFGFFKPTFDLRFDLTPQIQLSARIRKFVMQLSFNDFVANEDSDLDSNVQSGNDDLRQEWGWVYETRGEYRLPNDVGAVDVGAFYHIHNDRIERIDVTVDENNPQSTNGNIGKGDMYGLTANASLRMRMFGLPNLQLTANLEVKDSNITDPLLGINRRFRDYDRGRLNFGFRHDIPSRGITYGGNWSNRFEGNIMRYDVDDIEIRGGDPYVSIYAQFVDSRGLTYRLFSRNHTDNTQCRERRRFLGKISAQILEEIENRCWNDGRVVALRVSGNF